MKGFVVGVSGGIDSAVVSTLAAKTGMKTIILEMPIRQKQDQVNRAQEHINYLTSNFSNVEGLRVDLTPTFDVFQQTVDVDESKFTAENLALANSRARLRMLTLYYYGQINGLLVTGTGNKVEDFGVGFFTKYGDGGVDISPIADLLKSEVYQVAKELQIAESIQKAMPTDGLWDVDRTDEDQMGASYPELDGTNLQTIIDAINNNELPDVTIAEVIADRDCYGLVRALDNDINSYLLGKNEDFTIQLNEFISNDVDVIILAGFLSILPKEFCEKWDKKIINIHPSLLPKYGGK
ncbi:unnamed protein product, partial [Cyprideis torosa]